MVLWNFSITSKFLGLKIQKSFFLKKIRVLSAVFFRFEVQVISTRLADLKSTKPLNVCL